MRRALAAQRLAGDPALQRALRGHDQRTIKAILSRVPGAHLGNGTRAVSVLYQGRLLGRISVSVPLDDRTLGALAGGLQHGDRLVVVRGTSVVAGGTGTVDLAPGRAARVRLGDTDFRGLETAELPGGVTLAALTPQHRIDAAVRTSERTIFIALLASLLLFGTATYVLGRSVVRTLGRLVDAANAIAEGRLGGRVDVRGRDEFAQLGGAFNRMAATLELRLAELETERSRVRGATARFGEALAATHDPGQLIQVVVQSAVEATGAAGGVVLGPDGELARAGDPDAGFERLAFPLRVGSSDFGSLVLTSDSFEAEHVETAASLAAQVVVALENARLHRMVERQAMVDSLTGLANRRSLEESLARRARACAALRRLSVRRARRPRRLQAGERPVRSRRRRRGTEGVRAPRCARRCARATSPAAGAGRSSRSCFPARTRAGGARLAERARTAIESAPRGDAERRSLRSDGQLRGRLVP